MIQANHVNMRQQCTRAIDPPTVAGGAKGIPVVDRISPQLALRAAVVRRDPGNGERPAPCVEKRQLGIRPDVTRVRRNEEGQIANQSHAPGMGVVLELIGLS